MTSEHGEEFIDVDRPDGERIRLRFRGDSARHPEVAAELVDLLLEAIDGSVYEAVTNCASGFGLRATYYLGSEWVSIEIYEPMALHPLVNASGGSPLTIASRHPKIGSNRPLGRLLRSRAPVGR